MEIISNIVFPAGAKVAPAVFFIAITENTPSAQLAGLG